MDSDAIYQCLSNLISNAIDACNENMLPETQKIVALRTTRDAGCGVEYQVEDKWLWKHSGKITGRQGNIIYNQAAW